MPALSKASWRGGLIIVAVLAILVGAATAEAAAPPKAKAPRKVYLALGDSLAIGAWVIRLGAYGCSVACSYMTSVAICAKPSDLYSRIAAVFSPST